MALRVICWCSDLESGFGLEADIGWLLARTRPVANDPFQTSTEPWIERVKGAGD